MRSTAKPKRVRKHMLMVQLSAELEGRLDRLVEFESRRRGYTITKSDITRELISSKCAEIQKLSENPD